MLVSLLKNKNIDDDENQAYFYFRTYILQILRSHVLYGYS